MSNVIAIACDHAGLSLKETLRPAIGRLGFDHRDFGTFSTASIDYPDYAHQVAEGVAQGHYRFGVLVCGTGIGMSMAANRHVGVRAAVCEHAYTARMARLHNDANVLCLGARVVGSGLAEVILEAFLQTAFENGRHAARIAKIERA
jgi:ribose 5-phosphate isomerase B